MQVGTCGFLNATCHGDTQVEVTLGSTSYAFNDDGFDPTCGLCSYVEFVNTGPTAVFTVVEDCFDTQQVCSGTMAWQVTLPPPPPSPPPLPPAPPPPSPPPPKAPPSVQFCNSATWVGLAATARAYCSVTVPPQSTLYFGTCGVWGGSCTNDTILDITAGGVSVLPPSWVSSADDGAVSTYPECAGNMAMCSFAQLDNTALTPLKRTRAAGGEEEAVLQG